jgi:hypothetical protein
MRYLRMNREIVEILGWLPVSFVETVCAYIGRNDAGHSYEHVFDVVREADRLSGGDRNAILAAFMHDIACGINRDRHHQIGSHLAETLLRIYGIKCDQTIVARAILEHRASWKDGYSSKVSEYVAAADRGVPDADKHLKRSYLYARSKLGKTHEQSVLHAHEHIREKFLDNTPEVPDWYMDYYRAEWAEMRRTLRSETLEDTAERMRFM